jgi:hypothetical protein
MRTIQSYVRGIAFLSAIILLATLFVTSDASAQRRRVFVGGRGGVYASPQRYYPVYVSGHRYFYSGGYFYRGGRWGYAMIPAPIGARIRVLPYGFLTFNIGAVPYYYYGGVYYEYIPDQNVYVVVQKPSSAPAAATTATDNEDKAVLTDGTTLSGVFEGAGADSVQFRVNGQVRSIAITQITSINFAPSSFDTTGHK